MPTRGSQEHVEIDWLGFPVKSKQGKKPLTTRLGRCSHTLQKDVAHFSPMFSAELLFCLCQQEMIAVMG